MKKLPVCLVVFFSFVFLPVSLFGQGWRELGTGNKVLKANDQILGITEDGFGNIYAAGAFTDSIYPYQYFYVAKWDGTYWSKVGVPNYKFNGWIYSLTRDLSGNVYAAGTFTDTNGKNYVAKWDGSNWSKVGIGINALNANNGINSISSDNSGNLYAAAALIDSLNQYHYVAKWDGNNWKELGSGNNKLNANGVIWWICVDNKDNVYAGGYFSDTLGRQYIAKWNGNNWSELGTGNNVLNANGLIRAIVTDKIGNVYTTWSDNINGKSHVEKWDGNSWSELGIGNNVLNLSVLTISIDANDNIYAATSEDSTLNLHPGVEKWNGSNWSILGDINGLGISSFGQFIESMDISINGKIYVGGNVLDTNTNNNVYEYSPTCNSASLGGTTDSTDIGRFIIGNDTFGTVYSHLANSAAVNSYQENITVKELSIDSTYHIQEAGIMNTLHDADAKVTLFIDYNNNGQYDIPAERVWTAYARAFQYYIVGTDITIPYTAVTGVPLGMRLIINNDTGPSAASDSACGTYVSGETEDFVVVLKGGATKVGNLQLTVGALKVWPNPFGESLTLSLSKGEGTARAFPAQVKIFDIVGREIYSGTLNTSSSAAADRGEASINTSNFPRGTYILELRMADGGRGVQKIVKY